MERGESVARKQKDAALAAVARGRAGRAVTAAELGAVKVATLGIVGSEDPSLPGLREVKALMPAMGRLLVLDGANHGTAMKRPESPRALREHMGKGPPRE